MEIKLSNATTLLFRGKAREVFVQSSNIKIGDIKITGPGEYEVGGVQIFGVRAEDSINFKIKIDKLSIAVIFRQGELEPFGDVDILVSRVALGDLVLKLEPKIVVVWGAEGKILLKEVGKEDVAPSSKLSIKQEKLPAELEVVWLK